MNQSKTIGVRGLAWRVIGLCVGVLTLAAAPAYAVHREVKISAPVKATAGSTVKVSVAVSTDAGNGERIGFLHAEYSIDDGKTWTGFCFEQNAGPTLTRQTTFAVGAAGTRALVRVRVAFRDGQAGDVDFTGAAIKWEDSWAKWQGPPARFAATTVVAP